MTINEIDKKIVGLNNNVKELCNQLDNTKEEILELSSEYLTTFINEVVEHEVKKIGRAHV